MEGGERTRTEDEQGACWFPKSCSSASWRREAAALGDSKAPGTARSPAPCLVSASCARSPRLALPLSPSLRGSQPRRALPRPLPLPPPPTPTSREQEARGPAEGDQVGEAVLGEGTPRQPSSGLPNRCVDACDASWAQPAPRIGGYQGPGDPQNNQPLRASLGLPKEILFGFLCLMQLPSQLKPPVQDSHNPDILASHKTEQKPTNLTAPGP